MTVTAESDIARINIQTTLEGLNLDTLEPDNDGIVNLDLTAVSALISAVDFGPDAGKTKTITLTFTTEGADEATEVNIILNVLENADETL